MPNNVQNASQQITSTLMMITKRTMMMLMLLNSEEMMKISGRNNTMIIIQVLWMRQIKQLISDRLQQNQQMNKPNFTKNLFSLYHHRSLPWLMIEHKKLYKRQNHLLRTRNHDYMSTNYSKLLFMNHLDDLFMIYYEKYKQMKSANNSNMQKSMSNLF